MRQAIRYLRETQEDDGSWYGRWGVNYIYGTWQVLRGLRAIGEDMTQDWILRGRDWLESCQNDDGGWGESCASYENPDLKGQGAEHGVADGLGADGDLRLWRSRSAQHPAGLSLSALDRSALMAPGMNPKLPGRASHECFISSTTCIAKTSRF